MAAPCAEIEKFLKFRENTNKHTNSEAENRTSERAKLESQHYLHLRATELQR